MHTILASAVGPVAAYSIGRMGISDGVGKETQRMGRAR
jgi:hypothetical protein